MGAQAVARSFGGVTVLLRSPILASLVGKSLEFLTLVLLVTVVPRLLGTHDYGRFALAASVVAIASSSVGLGGPTVLSRFIPPADPKRQAGLAYSLVRRVLGLRLAQMLTLASAGAVAAIVAPEQVPRAATALVVIAITLDVGATLAFQTALAFGRTRLWSFRWPMQNVFLLGFMPILYYVGGVLGAIAAMPLAAMAVMAIAALSVRGRVAPPPVPLPKGILRFGVLTAGSSVLTQARQRGTVPAVSVLGGSTAETGFTALATNIGLAATYAVSQIFTVELPRMAKGLADDPEGVVASARRLSSRLTIVVIPASLGCVLVVDEIMPRLAGEGFSAGVDAIAPALAAVPLTPVTALVAQLAALHLRVGARLVANMLGTLAFAMTALFAVPAWGATGGTAAFLCGVAVSAGIGALMFRNEIGVRRPAIAAAGSAAVLVVGLVL
jgi:O-antigen/teichoic acid export membrane protein